ncbi:fungal-specific transcription factor domain-containing protein [Mucidula mucida]|nr:fungal-specific transcription factor domain-containing protein [Mucidula mucida]
MSSDEHHDGDDSPAMKKRKMQRACDICRRKKSEGGQMPDTKCINCQAYDLNCTYIEAAKKRRHPKGYVEALEKRLERMDKLLHKFMPDSELARELEITEPAPAATTASPREGLDPSIIKSVGYKLSVNPEDSEKLHSMIARSLPKSRDPEPQNLSDDDEEELHQGLTKGMKELQVSDAEVRFFGKSSGAALVQSALSLREHLDGTPSLHPKFLENRRPEFWTIFPWESEYAESGEAGVVYDFPPCDLMESLIDLYFTHINLFLPLLHRPTFVKSLAEGLHHVNKAFGATVLLVCAVGSRFSDDPRVSLTDTDEVETHYSSGWKWFVQVRRLEVSLLGQPSVYDLQKSALSVMYMQGCSAPHACWTTIGTGIRMAQDVGAHRKRNYQRVTQTKVEEELWKRAFWCLVCMDREMSLSLGRPCAIHDEDIDVGFPIACDDEYWYTENPEDAFVQPPDKPSVLAFFHSYLDLNQILAFCMRTTYSIGTSRSTLGFVGDKWKKHIVTELDSALNKWVDSIPDHIRWDPHREDDRFFSQSVALYCWYYHLQILIHRPFIPSARNPNPTSFPSLSICTNAARVTSHILDCRMRRGHSSAMQQCAMPVFSAAIVLLLSIWSAKRSGMSFNYQKEMDEVYKCMKALKSTERQLHFAGRLWDILYELASAGELPLPRSPANKRELDMDSPKSSEAGSSPAMSGIETPDMSHRPIIKNKRVSATYQQQPTFAIPTGPELCQPLPMSTFGAQYNEFHSQFLTSHMPAYTNQGPSTPSLNPMDAYRWNQAPDMFSGGNGGGGGFGPLQTHNGYDIHGAAQPYHATHGDVPAPSTSASALLDTEAMSMWPTGFELEDWGQYLSSVSDLTHNGM